MKRINLLWISAIMGVFIFFTGCVKESNSPSNTNNGSYDSINYFIWSSMYNYYLWNANVPKLTANYFDNNVDNLYKFLNTYDDHEALFYDLLYQYGTVDRWSWIVSDYEELIKEFEGISTSMGYNFMPYLYGNGKYVLGSVRYVVKNGPADLAGVKRGDIFTTVNGQLLTIDNYYDLLYNSNSYTLSFADIVDKTLVLNGKTAAMTAVEVTEDPILLDSVYTVNDQKIGYLVYNNFVSEYDQELNNVILDFKNKGISKLILDLRYNTGGAGSSAIYLASMIYGTQTSKVFYTTQYNADLQAFYYKKYGGDFFINKFASNIENSNNTLTPINELDLNDVYIITSDNTASASELVINGLKPYMNVYLVGDTTHGKYVGSVTIADYIDEEGNVNPKNKWALQPIVMKVSNSLGVTDYSTGFVPNVALEEDLANLSVLGSLDEPLLAETMAQITGSSKKHAKLPHVLNSGRISDFHGLFRPVSGLRFNAPAGLTLRGLKQ